ncbi:MAG: rhodanese-like domain-containing protein [Flavobacteriales bacterium]|nr:rhodanese-like domain-containing protein [Flavobacteriales bacterium]
MGIFSTLFGGSKTNDKVAEYLQKGALIVDVRTPQEYRAGHIKQSVNIPLNTIPNKVNELKRKNKPIITCCRSGARSGMAADQLRSAGIEVVNGGPWNSVQAMM